jgi:serine/threonine protein kinase
MDADLYEVSRAKNILTDKHRKYILYQIARAIHYIHEAGLIHRDLKPSNILINEECDAKVCDFGLVRSIDEKNETEEEMMTEYIATRWYRAP